MNSLRFNILLLKSQNIKINPPRSSIGKITLYVGIFANIFHVFLPLSNIFCFLNHPSSSAVVKTIIHYQNIFQQMLRGYRMKTHYGDPLLRTFECNIIIHTI
jgi:hypothetical protein